MLTLLFDLQDEKPAETKKEADDAMKVDEQQPSGSKSPSAAADASASTSTSTSKPPTKRTPEPSSERLTNFTRVTPAQFAYISFPPEDKYQPVRAISSLPQQQQRCAKRAAGTGTPTKYAGGGRILLLVAKRPQETVELIDLTPPTAAPAVPEAAAVAAAANPSAGSYGGLIDENGREAEMPPAFEVSL